MADSTDISSDAHADGRLRRDLGTFGAVLLGLGAMLGTGVFVSIGVAAGVAGPPVIAAIVIAGFVALCNGLSSAQLAASHPVSGGTYEYGYRYLNAPLGFTAGWMFLCAKSASAAAAAIGVGTYLNSIGAQKIAEPQWIAIGLVWIVGVLVMCGAKRSNVVNAIILLVTLAALATYVVVAMGQARYQRTPLLPNAPKAWMSFFEACALMFVAYTGYGRVATMGEEVRDPQKAIPRAIVLSVVISGLIYVLVAIALMGTVHWGDLAEITFSGDPTSLRFTTWDDAFERPEAARFVSIGAVAAMLGVLLNLVLGLSRVALAMGRRLDLPAPFARLNAARTTPVFAVPAVTVLIIGLCLIGDFKRTWSFSAFTVLIYYAITNLAALRLPLEQRRYPRAFAWMGLASCLFLAFWVEWKVWLAGTGVLLAGLGWHFWRARLRKPLEKRQIPAE